MFMFHIFIFIAEREKTPRGLRKKSKHMFSLTRTNCCSKLTEFGVRFQVYMLQRTHFKVHQERDKFKFQISFLDSSFEKYRIDFS